MKLRSKNTVIAAAAALALLGGVGVLGVTAYLTDTETTDNVFTVGEVIIDSQEPNYPGNGSDETEDLVPLEEVKKDPQIKNTGKNPAVVFQQVDIPMNSLILAEDDGTRLPKANVEVFDFRTSDGLYDSVNEKWILISQEYLTADDQPSDQENAAKVRRIYGYENVLAEDSTTTSLFDVVRLCNVVEGQIDNSVQTINITSYAIQADNIAGITSAHWNETMDQAKLTEIFEVYMNQSGEIVSDDADNSNNQTIIGTTLNVSMTAPNRHLRLNTGNAEDTRTTLVYDVAYTGSNEEPIPVFESSNPDVATVDQAGNIQAVGVGTTTITMSAENPDTGNIASTTLTITVRDVNAGEFPNDGTD